MTPEAQRIAIAHACGIAGLENRTLLGYFGIPDYLNSLDAMVAAEAIIGDAATQIRYAANVLIEMGFPDLHDAHDLNVDYCWHALGASPKQRAKAFLRTLNLWKP